MNIELKLYASLASYLPAGAKDNKSLVNVPDGLSVRAVMDHFKLPLDQCHLVILNGVFVAPEARMTTTMKAGDTLALWPPVAGG